MNEEVQAQELILGSTGTLEASTRAEVDIQIETAKKYPRDVKRSMQSAKDLIAMDPEIAEDCHFSVPRDGKNIDGPSVRLAEIIASTWGNLRVATRIREIGDRDVVAEAACHDLENNVSIVSETRRRITSKSGRRYSDDMIGLTCNAAASIAMRNAIFRVIPKAFWTPVYKSALKAAAGGKEPIAQRRQRAFAWFEARGVAPELVIKTLGKRNAGEVDVEALQVLNGWRTALSEETTTIEEVFGIAPKSEGEKAPVRNSRDLSKEKPLDSKDDPFAGPKTEEPREPGSEG